MRKSKCSNAELRICRGSVSFGKRFYTTVPGLEQGKNFFLGHKKRQVVRGEEREERDDDDDKTETNFETGEIIFFLFFGVQFSAIFTFIFLSRDRNPRLHDHGITGLTTKPRSFLKAGCSVLLMSHCLFNVKAGLCVTMFIRLGGSLCLVYGRRLMSER